MNTVYHLRVQSKKHNRDFPSGPVVKNSLPNAGDMGLIPGGGTKIPHVTGQLSLPTTTREAHALQQRPSIANTKNK